MKDMQGIELKIGDRVAFTVGTVILLGNIERFRTTRRWNTEYNLARVRLAVPEHRAGQTRAKRDEAGQYVRDEQGSLVWERSPDKIVLWREVDSACRIVLCPEVVK